MSDSARYDRCMRMLLLGALAVLSSCSKEEAVAPPRPANVVTTSVSAPSVDLRGEVDFALKNEEALALLAVWTNLGRLGGHTTNP